MRILHCSDVHITQNYRAARWTRLGWRRWVGMLEHTLGGRAAAYRNAGATLRRIAATASESGVDHVVVTGDLTAYATELEFQEVKEALGALGTDRTRCSVVPGNHDRFTPGSVSTGRFERHFSALLETDLPEFRAEGPYPFVRLLGDDTMVVGLCSARLPALPGFGAGRVGRAQLDALSRLVGDPRFRHRAVLVLVHHAPVRETGGPDSAMHGLRDADELLRLLPGPRYAILHGHLHGRYSHPATGDRPHLFSAGSSTRLGHEGYWIIEVAHGAVVGGTLISRVS